MLMTHRREKKIFKIPNIPQLKKMLAICRESLNHKSFVFPSLKQTASLHLRMDGLNTISCPVGAWPICRDQLAVSFRGGCILKAAASPPTRKGSSCCSKFLPTEKRKGSFRNDMTWIHGMSVKNIDRFPVSLSLGGSPEVAPLRIFPLFKTVAAALQGPYSNRCFLFHSFHL